MATPAAPAPTDARPDYGLDAPGVVRNLTIVTVVGLATWIVIRSGFWTGRIPLGVATVETSGMWISVAVGCGIMAGWMTWSSTIGKLSDRERLLDAIVWTGDERVLDVGCGRGLMLIGAAKRAPRGTAVGVDLWQAEDLSGNRPEATLENARREGVGTRVRVETADMRQLPFPDASFDAIVSRAAIHNVYDAAGRAQAVREIARVLAPGGRAMLDDIRHVDEYERAMRAAGITDVRRVGSPVLRWLLTIWTFGSLRPDTLVVRRAKS